MPETHLNTYIEEAEKAYQKAVAALGTFKEKADALRAKYEGTIKELSPEIQAGVALAENEAKKEEKPKDKSNDSESDS